MEVSFTIRSASEPNQTTVVTVGEWYTNIRKWSDEVLIPNDAMVAICEGWPKMRSAYSFGKKMENQIPQPGEDKGEANG